MTSFKEQVTHIAGLSRYLHIVVFTLTLAAVVSFALLIDTHHQEMIVERTTHDLESDILVPSSEVMLATTSLRNNTLFLSRTPPLRGIVRAARNGGMDPVDHNSQTVWARRLEEIFTAFLNTRPEYAQARYIGVADGGRELVRVDRKEGTAVVIPEAERQHTGHRDYFRAGLTLTEGEVYLSEFNLNQEHGVIKEPVVPTIRGVTPILDEDGKVFGLLVLNMDVGPLFSRISRRANQDQLIYAVDEQGRYLSNPDPTMAFSFELGNTHRLQTDFPALASILNNDTGSDELATQDYLLGDSRYYLAAQRLRIDPMQPDRFVLLAYALPEARLTEEINYFRGEILNGALLALLIILPLLFSLIARILRPLRQLSQAAETISQGRYAEARLPNVRFGEIGILVAGFRHMLQQVAQREKELRQHNIALTRQVHKGAFDLRLAGAVVENTSEGVMVTDSQRRLVSVNAAFTEITGFTAGEALGNTPKILRSDHHHAGFYSELWEILLREGHWQGEIWNRRKNGELYLSWLSIDRIAGDTPEEDAYIGIFTDITEQHHKNERIHYLAFHDALTGLPNRSLAQDRLQHAINMAQRSVSQVAVMLIDLDRFKAVNDRLGHDVGDLLLKEVAGRIQATLRKTDTVARMGGDEFLLILENVEVPSYSSEVASEIILRVSEAFEIQGHQIEVGASIGIAIYPNDGETITTLIKQADIAMYRAKKDGKGVFRFAGTDITTSGHIIP